jgi:hypothetical protein
LDYRRREEVKGRWCRGCAKARVGAVQVGSKKCGGWLLQLPSFRLSAEGKARGYSGCAKAHVRAVSVARRHERDGMSDRVAVASGEAPAWQLAGAESGGAAARRRGARRPRHYTSSGLRRKAARRLSGGKRAGRRAARETDAGVGGRRILGRLGEAQARGVGGPERGGAAARETGLPPRAAKRLLGQLAGAERGGAAARREDARGTAGDAGRSSGTAGVAEGDVAARAAGSRPRASKPRVLVVGGSEAVAQREDAREGDGAAAWREDWCSAAQMRGPVWALLDWRAAGCKRRGQRRTQTPR